MKTYSMNDEVYFKITERGHKILNQKATEFHRNTPECDIKYKPDKWRGEWYKNQLWWLFEEFGGTSYVGFLAPVTDITFEEPQEEDNAKDNK